MYEVREATLEDAQYIAAHLREADRTEFGLGGGDPEAILMEGLEHSNEVIVLVADGKPYFIGGMLKELVGAIVWACGTDDVKEHSQHLMKESSAIIERWTHEQLYLHNVVWSGNELHIKWLKHMGFNVAQEIEHHNTTYKYFSKGVTQCVQ